MLIETNHMNGKTVVRSIKIEHNVPTLENAATLIGRDVANDLLQRAYIVAFQQTTRALLEKTGDDRMNDRAITEHMNTTWKPGMRKADPQKKIATLAAAFAKLDPKMQAELMKQFRSTSK